jgi:hypothetical protein
MRLFANDAMKVVYEMESRYDALAVDGTFYQKSGIISGGFHDLATRFRRWKIRLKLRKMNDIPIPLIKGNMDDVLQENDNNTSE